MAAIFVRMNTCHNIVLVGEGGGKWGWGCSLILSNVVFMEGSAKRVYTSRKVTKMFRQCADSYQMVLPRKAGGKEGGTASWEPAKHGQRLQRLHNGYITVTKGL